MKTTVLITFKNGHCSETLGAKWRDLMLRLNDDLVMTAGHQVYRQKGNAICGELITSEIARIDIQIEYDEC